MCQNSSFPIVIQILHGDNTGIKTLSRPLEAEEIKKATCYLVQSPDDIPSGVVFKVIATRVNDISNFYSGTSGVSEDTYPLLQP